MVTRVEGNINGYDIIFSLKGNKWKALVPRSEDGEYVSSLYAYDDYGNVSYLATILFEVKGYVMRASLLKHGFTSDDESDRLISSIISNKFSSEIQNEQYLSINPIKYYIGKIMTRGYEVECSVCRE